MDPRIQSHSLQSLPKPARHVAQRHVQQPGSFQQLLQTELHTPAELKISKHAQQRMDTRGIDISTEQWMTIHEKVKEAKAKGVNDSLVLTSDAALVVSAKNNTVITVLDREEAKSQIFTNINGTIVID